MTINNRGCFRFPVHEDRAEITVLVNHVPHSAILADMSAGGFGLLVLRGLQLGPDSQISLVMDDMLFECRVAYARSEEAFQFLGLERLRDVSVLTMPKMSAPTSFYKESFNGSNPLIFVAVVFGFSGLMIATLSTLGIGGGGAPRKSQTTVTNIRDLEDQQQDVVKAGREFRDHSVQQAKQTVAKAKRFVLTVSEQQSRAASVLTGSKDVAWDTLVKQLDLTGQQVERLLELANESQSKSGSNQLEPTGQFRENVLDVLTPEQRRRFSQLIATGSF